MLLFKISGFYLICKLNCQKPAHILKKPSLVNDTFNPTVMHTTVIGLEKKPLKKSNIVHSFILTNLAIHLWTKRGFFECIWKLYGIFQRLFWLQLICFPRLRTTSKAWRNKEARYEQLRRHNSRNLVKWRHSIQISRQNLVAAICFLRLRTTLQACWNN